MLELMLSPSLWISLITLTALELVLGIDNLIFISIAVSRLPKEMQRKARYTGLALALVMRLILLYAAAWLIQITEPLFVIFNQSVSVCDLFMFMGGAFLIVKATNEIHLGLTEGREKPRNPNFRRFIFVIFQIILLDLVFSFDSIMTAIGLTHNFAVMATSVIIAIFAMMFLSGPMFTFISKYPGLKVLALSFLMLIGMSLIASAMHFNIPHGYIYFAMFFSLSVELLNILSGRRKAVKVEEGPV